MEVYTDKQVAEMAIQNQTDIALLKAEVASAHRRIDENDRLTSEIHQLAENVATMSVEVKMLAEKVDTNIEEMKSDIKEQSKRITTLEAVPAKKWDKLVWLILGAIVSALGGFIAGGVIN